MFLDMGVFILILILAFSGVFLLAGFAVIAIIFLAPEIASEYRIRKHKADIEYMDRIQELEEEYKAAHGIKDYPYTEESHICRLSGRVVNDEYIPCEETETSEVSVSEEPETELSVEEESSEKKETVEELEPIESTKTELVEEEEVQPEETTEKTEEPVQEKFFEKLEEKIIGEPTIESQPEEKVEPSQIHLDNFSNLVYVTSASNFDVYVDATGKWYAVDKNSNAYTADTAEELNKLID